MAANNQIEVTLVDGFLVIKNTTVANAVEESYLLSSIVNVNKRYTNYTALNAYQPGRHEYNEAFVVELDFQEAPTDLVSIRFDIQDVTNQAGWTSNLAGLNQATTDIKTAIAASAGGGGGAITPPTSFTSGRAVVTTAGTAVPLAGVSTPITQVIVTAEIDNTNTVVIGGSGVVAALLTREGTPLEAGDSVTIDIDDLNKIYIDSLVSGEGVTFNYFN